MTSSKQEYKLQNKVMRSLEGDGQNNPLQMALDKEDSDIFNDLLAEGGGIEPSIDESIRDSIKCSFVSSEAGFSRQH